MRTHVLSPGLGMGLTLLKYLFGWIAAFGLTVAPAYALEYSTAVIGTINGNTTCSAGNYLERTINVPMEFDVTDLNLGILITHSWRGDVPITLISPSGTAVDLVDSDPFTGSQDNYNIELDDGAATIVNIAPHDTNDGTAAPPYENAVRPDLGTLATFNGEPARGNWTIRMCDVFPGADNGQFERATLFFPDPPPGPTTPLTCPIAQQSTLVWGAPGTSTGWASGDLTGSYTVGATPLSINITGDTNRLIVRNGVQTPVTSTEFTGGNLAGDYSLMNYLDLAATSESIIITLDVGTPGAGVASLGFDGYDIDQGAWTDRLAVTASLSGTAVPVTLSTSPANTAAGNVVTGIAPATSTQSYGNVNFAVLGQVDQVQILYDNAAAAANPAPQVFSMFANLALCPLPMADLSAVKSAEVYDPGGQGGLYSVPGQDMLYRIAVTNSSAATSAASNINFVDTLPDNLRFISASTTGFTGGSFTAPALPAVNTDCSGGACVISFQGASLGIGETAEVQIIAQLK